MLPYLTVLKFGTLEVKDLFLQMRNYDPQNICPKPYSELMTELKLE